jgi:hypothetical protein
VPNDECRYDILGTTLTASSLEKGPNVELLDIASTNIIEQANNCLSCPPILLQAIRDVSRYFWPCDIGGLPLKENDQLLSIVHAFDPHTWAIALQHVSSSFDLEKRVHIGFAYKAAVKIYILRATVPMNPISITKGPLEDLVSEIFLHLSYVTPADPFFKATCWPSFIAGAETNNLELRAWVSSRFEKGLQTLPWGYLSSAVELLNHVWTRKSQEEADADWLTDLKLTQNDWLIA